MSEGDFEVLPRGTIEEIRVLREFVTNISAILFKIGLSVPDLLAS